MACETCRLLQELLESAGVSSDLAKRASKVAEPLERAAKKKVKRKASAYSIKYGKAFKKVAGKYKLKSGKWAKDGFKACAESSSQTSKENEVILWQARKNHQQDK